MINKNKDNFMLLSEIRDLKEERDQWRNIAEFFWRYGAIDDNKKISETWIHKAWKIFGKELTNREYLYSWIFPDLPKPTLKDEFVYPSITKHLAESNIESKKMSDDDIPF